MAQTLTDILIHLVFSTKRRERFIIPDIESELFAYIGGVSRNHGSPLLAAGAADDHIHLLIAQSKNFALSNLVKEIKVSTSLWIKEYGPRFRRFHWQDGYAAFSISKLDKERVRSYIANQREHHRHKSFREELIELLEEYGVEYDERYLLS
jgi:putative transposase